MKNKSKKIALLLFVITVMMAITCFAASAAETFTDGNYTYTVTDETAKITAVDKTVSGKVEIPGTLGGYPVTAIGGSAFKDYTAIEEIVIPASVKTIGDYSFSGCTNLSKVTLKEGLEKIGLRAFEKCSALTALTLPDSVTYLDNFILYKSAVETINYPQNLSSTNGNPYYGYGPFDGSNIKTVIIPDGVTEIVNYVFIAAEKLENIAFPESVTKIGRYAFLDCKSLKNIDMSESITEIGDGAFSGCLSLEGLVFPDSVTTMGDYVISGCEKIKTINYPVNISKTTGSNGIFDGSCIETVTIPREVKKIIGSAFRGCTALKEVIIEEGVEEIGSSAFSGCTGLTEIEIPGSVKIIGSSAFSGCTGLTEIEIPGSVKIIGSSAFYNCKNLKTVTLNEGLESINSYAFRYCEAIEKITLPEGVTSIGDLAFESCKSLKEITLPETLTVIYTEAFSECTALKEIEIPASVKTIGSFVFSGCTNLNKVILHEGLESLGRCAFDECTSLSELTLPDSITFIDRSAFYGAAIESINYPASLRRAGTHYSEGVFSGSNIKTVILPDGITEIISYAFLSAPKLENIVIPESVTKIGDSAFYGCVSLKTVVIPESVTEIGGAAFYGCTGLGRIKIPDTVTTIRESAFSGFGENFVILCNSGTAAHQRAVTDSVPFILLDNHKCEPEFKNQKDATCTSKGTKYYVCTICEVEITEAIPAKGHSMGEWYVKVEVACGKNGYEIRECANCNYDERNTLTAPEHTDIITLPAVAATCTQAGLTEGKKCSACGTVTVAQQIIPKKDHVYVSTTTSATCTANGKTVYTCTCSDSYSEIIPTTGHDYQNGTCTKCGDSKADTCSHMCHKGGFMGFIWKIVQFFQKLFKTNPVCECGVAHY